MGALETNVRCCIGEWEKVNLFYYRNLFMRIEVLESAGRV